MDLQGKKKIGQGDMEEIQIHCERETDLQGNEAEREISTDNNMAGNSKSEVSMLKMLVGMMQNMGTDIKKIEENYRRMEKKMDEYSRKIKENHKKLMKKMDENHEKLMKNIDESSKKGIKAIQQLKQPKRIRQEEEKEVLKKEIEMMDQIEIEKNIKVDNIINEKIERLYQEDNKLKNDEEKIGTRLLNGKKIKKILDDRCIEIENLTRKQVARRIKVKKGMQKKKCTNLKKNVKDRLKDLIESYGQRRRKKEQKKNFKYRKKKKLNRGGYIGYIAL